ncbi:S41 family peptidase [Polyangium sp. y55x31]|uniref:S41 family peptidase n=1 Tax=Polyangium sp. y55x31 TaxID=3042688 RepID=UPI002482A40E|nr:S41 family peptidase [Polyangium sp. y55x31]MDI1484191.1 S41 family peptidase [Polyangium sp. y55x31]
MRVFAATLGMALLTTLSGCASAPRGVAADVDQLLTEIRENYGYLEEQSIDWDAVRRRYAARAADVRTKAERVALFEVVLDELHDAHAHLGTNTKHSYRLVPSGADLWAEVDGTRAIVTQVRPGSAAARAGLRAGQEVLAIGGVPVARAIAERLGMSSADPAAHAWALRSLLAGRHDERRRLRVATAAGPRDVELDAPEVPSGDGMLEQRRLAGGVGYLRIHNSLGDDALVPAFDAALAELGDCRALVLDLRDTPSGGNTAVAEALLGRFVREPLPYQKHELPGVGWQGRSRVWVQYVLPRGPFTYEKPLAVLVDHWTGSMGEGMAIGVDAMRRGVVVGTGMAGLKGAITSSTLNQSGIRFAIPVERLFHIDGTPRHRWLPPERVDLIGHDAPGEDAILARALEILASPSLEPGQRRGDSPPSRP